MACNKTRFDFLGAQNALAAIPKSRTLERKPIRSYYCFECKAYHLTSKSEFREPYTRPSSQRKRR